MAMGASRAHKGGVFAALLAVAVSFACVLLLGFPCAAHADDVLPQPGNKVSSVTVDTVVMPESTAYWLSGQDELTRVDLHGLYTAETTNMKYMFQDCSALAELDLSNIDTSSATDMTGMFEGMASLEKVTLGDDFSFRGVRNELDTSRRAVLPGGYWVNSSQFKKPKYAETDSSGNYLNAVSAADLAANYGTSNEAKYAPGVYVRLTTYTLSFTNGGDTDVSGPLPPARMLIDGTSTRLPEVSVTRESYRAVGWVEVKDDGAEGTKFAAGANMKMLRDIKLKPRWEYIPRYTVTFAKGSDSGVTGTPPASYGPVDSGTPYTLPGITFSRPGYRPAGWIEVTYSEGTRVEGTLYGLGSKMTVRRDVTLEPVWKPLQLSASVPTEVPLLLKGDGSVVGPTQGTAGSSISNRDKFVSFLVTSMSVTEGSDLTIVEAVQLATNQMTLRVTPRKQGAVSDGSALALNSTSAVTPDSAKRYEWEVPAQKELYLGYSGQVASDTGSRLDELLDDGLDAGTVTWQLGQPDPIVVAYDANGGSGSMESQKLTASVEFAAPPCTFEAPSGKSFAGWATSANGSVVYAPYATVQVVESTTLYAKWT